MGRSPSLIQIIQTVLRFCLASMEELLIHFSANDNTLSFTINDLAAGSYDLYARWGNNECPVDLPDVTLSDRKRPIRNGL